jgi:hypothetical protein
MIYLSDTTTGTFTQMTNTNGCGNGSPFPHPRRDQRGRDAANCAYPTVVSRKQRAIKSQPESTGALAPTTEVNCRSSSTKLP